MAHFQETFTPTGTLVLSNFGGLEVELSSCCTVLRYRFNYGDVDVDDLGVETEIVEAEEPNDDGDYESGFYVEEQFYSLSEFMRV